jgi:hypothetical protein
MQGAGQHDAFSSVVASAASSAATVTTFTCPSSAASAVAVDTANRLTTNSMQGNKIQFIFIAGTLSSKGSGNATMRCEAGIGAKTTPTCFIHL